MSKVGKWESGKVSSIDFVALDACGAYSSIASLKIVLSLEKTQI